MNWYNKLKIGTKIISGFLSVAIVAGIIGLVGIYNIKKIDRNDTLLYELNARPLGSLIKIAVEFQRTRVNLRELVIDKNEKDIQEHLKRLRELLVWLNDDISSFSKEIVSEDIRTEYEITKTSIDKYNAFLKTTVDYILSGSKDNAVLLMRGEGLAIAKDVDNSIQRLIDMKVKQGKERSDLNTLTANRSASVMIIILFAGIVLAVLFGLFIKKIITSQLGGEPADVVEISNRLARGDFTVNIDLKDGDNKSALAAMKLMAEKLEKTVTEIIDASQNLAQAVDQIAMGNQNLSQRTSEQASSLEEIAATIEEASSAINLNFENSLNANRVSDESTKTAILGGELVDDTVKSINEINSSTKKIGEITGVINEIAFQTNLLALNAAVEAARAGEQGRGFAVVAGEVRNLAQRAGSAAKEIAKLIDDTVAKISSGTDKTYRSGESLNEIIVTVKNVANMISEISASSREQKQGMEQIATAVTDLDGMTQHNAALVEETAGASEEMANQAQELMALMSQFKIRRTDYSSRTVESGIKAVKHDPKSVRTADGNGNGRKGAFTLHPEVVSSQLEAEGFDKF